MFALVIASPSTFGRGRFETWSGSRRTVHCSVVSRAFFQLELWSRIVKGVGSASFPVSKTRRTISSTRVFAVVSRNSGMR